MTIRIGIVGYGNIGRGVETVLKNNPDMSLAGVFTRRAPETLKLNTPGAKAYNINELSSMQDKLDVLILCGGSATDLPVQTPELAKNFNVVDSFDTHAKIPEHFAAVDASAKQGGKTAVISVGWDPGLFSLARVYSESVLPGGSTYTFWGKGVSQGHSDAIRRIKGVADARQYTVPVPQAVERVRNGENPELSTREKHTRECFVVAEAGADLSRIENEIKTMPNYFADYDTTVTFISAEEMARDHSSLPHGGSVIHTGKSSSDASHIVEFSLNLQSNPEFTAGVLVAYARAAFRLNLSGQTGCKTVLDIPPAFLSPLSSEDLRKNCV